MENLSRELKSSGIYLLGNLIAKTLEKPAGLGLVLIRVCRVSVARSPLPKQFHWLELPSCPTRPLEISAFSIAVVLQGSRTCPGGK